MRCIDLRCRCRLYARTSQQIGRSGKLLAFPMQKLQSHLLRYDLHVPQDGGIENPSIASGHVRIGMAEHLGNVFNGRAAIECRGFVEFVSADVKQ